MATLKRRLHPSTHISRGSSIRWHCLPCHCQRLSCPEFLSFTGDGEMVLRSANFACTAQPRPWSTRQFQLTSSALEPRQSRESLVDGREPVSSSILCPGPSCSPQSSDPSFQYSMAPDRAPSESHTTCLPAITLPTSPLIIQFPHWPRFSIHRMLNTSFDNLVQNLSQTYRSFSSQIGPDQDIQCISLPQRRNGAHPRSFPDT